MSYTPDRKPSSLPYSGLVVTGLLISAVSVFILGILGVFGAAVCQYGLRDIRAGRSKGRFLGWLGTVIGALSTLFYLLSFLAH